MDASTVTLALGAATAGAAAGGAGHAPAPLDLLTDLAVIMSVAAATTVLFQKIRQPVVLGYLLAGLIVGPHLPIPLFASESVAHEMSELGVILLMFSLGLEFSLRKLIRVGPSAGLVAVVQCSLMIWLGYVTGRLFGWTPIESFFTGALIAISSTTIIVKAFAEQGVKGGIAEIVFGILIVEDVIAILLLAVLTPVASGSSLSAAALALTVGKLAAFLVGLMVAGILVVPRLVRMVMRIGRAETTVVACIGICFAFALLARKFGYSVALGAFLAGALVSESGEAKTIEHLIEPVRDMFAAIFFVSVGMLIDPALVATHWLAVVVLTVVVVGGKVFGVFVGSFLAGNGVRTSVQAGMSLAQIGEFSFIIAGVGVSLGAVRGFLYPVAVAVSALTTLVTPFLIRAAVPVASRLDRRLPPALQTFVTLYGSWVQQLRSSAPGHASSWARIRRLAGLLLLDLVLIGALLVTAALGMDRLGALAERHLGLGASGVRWLVVAAAALLALPFVLGAVRLAKALGTALAIEAIPDQGTGSFDLGAAPRKALVVTLQLAILLVAAIPLAALTQPFIGAAPGVVILILGLLALVVPFWRRATDLHGHVRAGAQVILEALARQTQDPGAGDGGGGGATDLGQLLPGMGAAAALRLAPDSPSVGRTLKQIDLRSVTGASVIAIDRGPSDLVHPSADERLRSGDVLILTGSRDAVAAARLVLAPAAALEPPPPR